MENIHEEIWNTLSGSFIREVDQKGIGQQHIGPKTFVKYSLILAFEDILDQYPLRHDYHAYHPDENDSSDLE